MRILEQDRIVRSAQASGDFLCKNVYVHGVWPLHSATFEKGNTAAIGQKSSPLRPVRSCVVLVHKYEIGGPGVSRKCGFAQLTGKLQAGQV